jgi:hypothetical protein
MTTTSKCLIEAKYAENAQTTQYTAPTGTRTIIDKCTATNVTGSPQTLSWNLVTAAGAAGASNTITYQKTVAAGATEVFPEMVGQVLNAGDFMSSLCSLANSIVIRASGREMS